MCTVRIFSESSDSVAGVSGDGEYPSGILVLAAGSSFWVLSGLKRRLAWLDATSGRLRPADGVVLK